MLRNHPSFPDAELAPESDAMNCVRVLTRVLPYIYEDDKLHVWEEKVFWGPRKKLTRRAALRPDVLFDNEGEVVERKSGDSETLRKEGGLHLGKEKEEEERYEDAKPLGEELIDTLLDLLFFHGFTLPHTPKNGDKASYAIWTSGVGCNTQIGCSKEMEGYRLEILRLLLTLCSKGMYLPSNMLPVVGVKAITYLATCPDKQVVLSVLCSLLNTVIKFNPASWKVPYGQMLVRDPKEILVTYALQFLLVVLVYPVPETGPAHTQKNYYRHFLGRLHRAQDFQFIVDGMMRILNQPIVANSSYLRGSTDIVKCAPEMLMLFWEITQCNKRFRSYIIETGRAHDFIVLILFYALKHKCDAANQGVVRMCVFLLQTLSVEPNFGTSINQTFQGQESLPQLMRINNFQGTYADFLIQSIYSIIMQSQGKLTAIYSALLAIIANISPYLQHVNAQTSARLLELFISMSAPSFLLANETNHELLHSLLESMNAIIEHQYSSKFTCLDTPVRVLTVIENPHFIYAILRSRKRFLALRTFTLESGRAEIERQSQQRKDRADASARESLDSLVQSPTSSSSRRPPSLPDTQDAAPSAFAIGDDGDGTDDDSEAPGQPTPAESTPTDSRSQRSHSRSRANSEVSAHDATVPVQLRGMSEKARGKLPAGAPVFRRQNSTLSTTGSISGVNGYFEPSASWIEAWVAELPLHTVLSVIEQLSPHIPRGADVQEVLELIRQTEPAGLGITPETAAPVKIHTFEFTPLSLGWYQALLYSFIFGAEMSVGAGRGTVGVWNGTAIKAFRVQEGGREGVSLANPRGAVDAVGRNVVEGVGRLGLGERVRGLAGAAGQAVTSGQGGVVREGVSWLPRPVRTGTGDTVGSGSTGTTG
jgi:hypothetical protein